MLDDKDEFEKASQWVGYTCPSCGGYKEQGCETCAEYVFWYSVLEPEMRKRDRHGNDLDTSIDLEELHAEIMRRMVRHG